MATFVYRNVDTNQMVYVPTAEFAGNPDWELISGGGGGGDASVVQAELDAHEAASTSAHGIPNTALLETQSGAQSKANAAASAAETAAKAASIPLVQKGQASGVATLGVDSKLTGAQMPVIAAGDIGSGTIAVARLPVGNSAGTVAAGDDVRITGAATASALTSGLAGKVGKGDLVFNVKDYGAVGNDSTDDLIAINAALAAAALRTTDILGLGTGPVVFFPPSDGYRVTGTVTVPDDVDLDMQGPIVYAGAGGEPALVLGSGVRLNHRKYKGLRVRRATLSSWASETDIGILVRNQFFAHIEVCEVRNFTIGMQCLGDAGQGVTYCQFHLTGGFFDNKIALDLTNNTGGYANQNIFYGGEFNVSSSTYTSTDRIGIRLNSIDGAYTNNTNTFYGPSFELKGGFPPLVAEGLCVYAPYGSQTTVKDARHESPDAIAIRTDNVSSGNVFECAFNLLGVIPTFEDLGTRPGSIVRPASRRMSDESNRIVYAVQDLHKAACYYNGSTMVNVPGLTIATSGTSIDDARGSLGLTLNANYLEVASSRIVGFYVSTRTIKRFCLTVDAEASFGGRVKVRAFDSSGTIITAAGTVRGSQTDWLYGASYGGSHGTTADATNPRDFCVGSNVDYIFVGVTGGSPNTARIRAIQLTTPETVGTAAVWLPVPDGNENFATTPPSAGTWEIGRRIWNAAPATGPAGWICTVAGTPGTWVGLGGAGGADVQVFAANGTWTKPASGTTTDVILVGSGAGGGSGRKGADGTIRSGGAGGAGGAISRHTFQTSILGATEGVLIAIAGTGGPAVTTDSTDGNPGQPGGTCAFGSLVRVSGSFAGAGGTATGAAGGAAGNGELPGAAGAGASATGAVGTAGPSSNGAAPGGGSGGGITSGDAASAGGSGGISVGSNSTVATGGVVDGAAPGTGVSQPVGSGRCGNSSGGGASSVTTNAQAGGAGGRYGAGGSGGGASRNATGNSGAGGAGGPGICIVITR